MKLFEIGMLCIALAVAGCEQVNDGGCSGGVCPAHKPSCRCGCNEGYRCRSGCPCCKPSRVHVKTPRINVDINRYGELPPAIYRDFALRAKLELPEGAELS